MEEKDGAQVYCSKRQPNLIGSIINGLMDQVNRYIIYSTYQTKKRLFNEEYILRKLCKVKELNFIVNE